MPPLKLSVNLSPRQFQHAGLIDSITQALAMSGLPPTSLQLEITEGIVMLDTEATLFKLRQLKDLGIDIAIDDFGTGYSSLAYLKRLPITALKIDQSFIKGIETNQEDVAIVRAIISMAKSLGLELTGEGVETAAQASLLEDWGCDRCQGYFFARPMDATALVAFLSTAKAATERARGEYVM